MIVKEFRELVRDRRTLCMLMVLPLLLLVIFGYAANFYVSSVKTAAGTPVMLAGRAIRVADADPAGLAEVLKAAGIEASLQPVPATISERMLMLSRQAKAS